MSKKRKRKNRSGSPSGQATPSGASARIPDNFDPDYTYVIKDLRTIGTLAAIFLTILVIISFFI
jgi:hypothetical protein